MHLFSISTSITFHKNLGCPTFQTEGVSRKTTHISYPCAMYKLKLLSQTLSDKAITKHMDADQQIQTCLIQSKIRDSSNIPSHPNSLDTLQTFLNPTHSLQPFNKHFKTNISTRHRQLFPFLSSPYHCCTQREPWAPSQGTSRQVPASSSSGCGSCLLEKQTNVNL